MRILLITFIIALLCPLLIEYSYSQTSQESGNIFFIFVQTQIRNSDNQLVAHLEADKKITILESQILNDFFDSSSSVATITMGGEKFDMARVDLQKQITESDTISKTSLVKVINGIPTMIASSSHDGYPIVAGDTVTSTWIIIRPSR